MVRVLFIGALTRGLFSGFVGKVFVLPSNSLVYNQGVGSLKWKFEGMRQTRISETSFPL